MSDQLTITEVEVAKELPDWQGKGAKVFRYTIEGDDRRPEDFVPNGSEPKKVGESIEGIEDGPYGSKVKKPQRSGGGGGFKRSPEETKRIVIQHSQGVAAQREANLVAAGRGLLTDDQWNRLVGWLTAEVYGKQKDGVIGGLLQSDVPGDTTDLPI